MSCRAPLLIAAALASAPAISAPRVEAAFVLLGENGQPTARIVVDGGVCPQIDIDRIARPMRIRAVAGVLTERPTLSTRANSKPSAFPVLTCEGDIPAGAKRASIAGRRLPLPTRQIRRIVVIGDTGCRLKASENAYQACNDPAQYPFARIAARAASWHPQLVVHVGDYLYRENPCPAGNDSCAGSPWGYGWDAWKADLFAPAAPLLAAAPWVVVRGNHENCARAGQGWWRLIDPRPLAPHRDCNDAADDPVGDASPPYAVPLGDGVQIVVADLAIASDKPTSPSDRRFGQFTAAYQEIKRLAGLGRHTLVATHKPIFGIAATKTDGDVTLHPATGGITSVFATLDPDILPNAIDVVLSGHVHLWEQVSFPNRYPTQFITGFSGTKEDVVPIPSMLPPGISPVPGIAPDQFSSWIDGFGYMTLERRGNDRWRAKVWNLAGLVVNRCVIYGRHSSCDRAQAGS